MSSESHGHESANHQALAEMLSVAHERLALYEGFDRVIEEWVQERAAAGLDKSTSSRMARELTEIETTVKDLTDRLSDISRRLEDLRGLFPEIHKNQSQDDEEPSSVAQQEIDPEPQGEEASHPSEEEPILLPPERRDIDIVLHDIPDVMTALAWQRHVTELEIIEAVELREFSEGILRLRVTAIAPLDIRMLVDWTSGAGMRVIDEGVNAIELGLGNPG